MLGVALLILAARGLCWKYEYGRTAETVHNNMTYTFFSSLENYQVNAVPTTEAQYPWVGRVVHSRELSTPHMCTAVCVQRQIFITAARCIYSLKVNHTSIIYMYGHHQARAFVVPSNGTKQAYDDIGFIVVEPGYKGEWHTIELMDKNRTDDYYNWFADLNLSGEEWDHKVVGYATQKGIHRIKSADRIFDLTELSVTVSIDLCHNILTYNHLIEGFYVPCYHSCTLQEFNDQDPKCKNYHGVEGGAVFDVNTKKLVGIASWGPYYHTYDLPVGFAVPNSENFFEDYECARRIRSDNGMLITDGHYQRLCNLLK